MVTASEVNLLFGLFDLLVNESFDSSDPLDERTTRNECRSASGWVGSFLFVQSWRYCVLLFCELMNKWKGNRRLECRHPSQKPFQVFSQKLIVLLDDQKSLHLIQRITCQDHQEPSDPTRVKTLGGTVRNLARTPDHMWQKCFTSTHVLAHTHQPPCTGSPSQIRGPIPAAGLMMQPKCVHTV